MKKIINFLRKIGVLHISSGDYTTSEYDSQSTISKQLLKIEPKKFLFLFVILVPVVFLLKVSFLSLNFFIILILWAIIFYLFRQFVFLGYLSLRIIIFIFVVGISVSYFLVSGQGSILHSLQSNTSSISELKQYDKKN